MLVPRNETTRTLCSGSEDDTPFELNLKPNASPARMWELASEARVLCATTPGTAEPSHESTRVNNFLISSPIACTVDTDFFNTPRG